MREKVLQENKRKRKGKKTLTFTAMHIWSWSTSTVQMAGLAFFIKHLLNEYYTNRSTIDIDQASEPS